jgi:hypothetical protein
LVLVFALRFRYEDIAALLVVISYASCRNDASG